MGNSLHASTKCPHCFCSVSKIQAELDESILTPENHCPRCHGALKKAQASPRSFFSTSNSSSATTSLIETGVPLDHVHIGIFETSLMGEEFKEMDAEYLRDTYIRPYFDAHPQTVVQPGLHLQIRGIDLKIYACYPCGGVVRTSTQFNLTGENGEISMLHSDKLDRVHILPTKASTATTPNNMLAILTSALVQEPPRHLIRGETFTQNGIEFRVMATEPATDGFFESGHTEVFFNGEPIPDCTRVKVAAVLESLPDDEKNMTSNELKERYGDSLFLGRSVYIRRNTEQLWRGISMAIVESDPAEGIVTCATRIEYAPAPLPNAALSSQQIEEDLMIARRMQEEENSRTPHRVIFRRLDPSQQQQLRQYFQLLPHSQRRLLEILSQQHQQSHGLENVTLERLPTWSYTNVANTSATEDTSDTAPTDAEDDRRSCRICLMQYDEGELIRALPCLHWYHKECVDRWLQMNTKCPICKTDVGTALGA